jgi:hypothetical protein
MKASALVSCFPKYRSISDSRDSPLAERSARSEQASPRAALKIAARVASAERPFPDQFRDMLVRIAEDLF